MNTHADKTQENKSQSDSNRESQMQSGGESTFQFVDNRPEAIAQRKLQEMSNNSTQVSQLMAFQDMSNNSPQAKQTAQLQSMTDNSSSQQPIQKKENKTGLPDNLKTGMENLSGMSMDDVKVHRNSDKPAQLQAHAYAQGTDIHLGPGQEKHLPHELGHVVQQQQGRVKPTIQMKGKVNINDDIGLEKEADEMGKNALLNRHSKSEPITQKKSSSVIQKVGEKKGELSAREEVDLEFDEFIEKVTTEDTAIEQATAVAGIVAQQAGAIYTGVNFAENLANASVVDSAEAATGAVKGVDATMEAAEGITASVLGGTLGVVGGVAGLVSASITLDDKRTKDKAYGHYKPKTKPTKEKNKAPESVEDIANYASAKNKRAMFEAWANVFQAIVKIASGALTIAGAAAGGVGATAGLVVGAANTGVSAIRGVARSGKAFLKFLKGTRGKNRATNAKKLVDLATGNDNDAADMLLEMDLGMIFGSIGHSVKRWIEDDMGIGGEAESLKNTDGEKLKNGATAKELIDVLQALNECKKSGDKTEKEEAELQYDGLVREIQQAMRSVV